MSQWDTYPCSVKDCSRPGECLGSGIYGIDGNTYAITPEMPQVSPAEMKRAIDYVKNSDYEKGIGLDFAGMKFAYLNNIGDGTYVFKRKAKRNENGDEIEKVEDRDKYQLFIELANTVAMVALFKGGAQGNHAEGVARMDALINYLKGQNM